MVIRILACAVLTGGCAYLGNMLSQTYRQKIRFWEQLQAFCRELRGDIGFLQTKIPELLQRGQKKAGIFADFLREIQNACEKGEELSLSCTHARERIAFFSEEDAALIFAFFGGLGKSDRENQLNAIRDFEKIL